MLLLMQLSNSGLQVQCKHNIIKVFNLKCSKTKFHKQICIKQHMQVCQNTVFLVSEVVLQCFLNRKEHISRSTSKYQF